MKLWKQPQLHSNQKYKLQTFHLSNSLKATTKVIKEEKDETLMTKEAFFAKIDRARAGEKIQMSREEMKKLMFD